MCFQGILLNTKSKTKVTIEALPNEKGLIDLGHGMLEQTHKGFHLTVYETKGLLSFSSGIMTSAQADYDYKVKGQCIVPSTKNCCYHIYITTKDLNATKIQFAAEAFYEMKNINSDIAVKSEIMKDEELK